MERIDTAVSNLRGIDKMSGKEGFRAGDSCTKEGRDTQVCAMLSQQATQLMFEAARGFAKGITSPTANDDAVFARLMERGAKVLNAPIEAANKAATALEKPYGEVVSTKDLPGGGKQTKYKDGTSEIITKKGDKVTTRPDGTVIVDMPDGNKITTRPDGTGVLQRPNGEKIELPKRNPKEEHKIDWENNATTNPDGTKVKKLDGCTQTRKPDGTEISEYKDGTVIVRNIDKSVTTTYPDGAKLVEKPDGSNTLNYPDGSVTMQKADGTKIYDVMKTHGMIITVQKDGTSVTEKKDGTIITEKPDGTKIVRSPDGTVTAEKVKNKD